MPGFSCNIVIKMLSIASIDVDIMVTSQLNHNILNPKLTGTDIDLIFFKFFSLPFSKDKHP